jgi:hypothetical protein
MSAKYESFADKHLSVVNRSGDEYMVRCVVHDDANASMQFNVESGLWLCFGCGAAGNIRSLERELGIRATEDAADLGDVYAKLDALKNPDAPILPVKDEMYLRRYQIPTRYWTDERGFEPRTIAAFDLGYDPVGDFMGPYVTIPIRNVNGGLLGVIKRYLAKDAELRYRYPKGFKRSENLFGSWMVEKDPTAHTVVLTEGAIDAMKVWQAGFPAMAIYGSSLSKTQVRLLNRLGVQKVVLLFDNDKAGWKATRSCLGVKEHKVGRIVNGRKMRVTEEQYEPLTDLSRSMLVTMGRYWAGGPSDPGGMDSRQIRRALRNQRTIDMDKLRTLR